MPYYIYRNRYHPPKKPQHTLNLSSKGLYPRQQNRQVLHTQDMVEEAEPPDFHTYSQSPFHEWISLLVGLIIAVIALIIVVNGSITLNAFLLLLGAVLGIISFALVATPEKLQILHHLWHLLRQWQKRSL